MAKYMKTVNHFTEPIGPVGGNDMVTVEGLPTELHMKQNGCKDGTPSFCIVIQCDRLGAYVAGQFSLKTLSDCLDELGYKIEKK